MGVRNTKQRQVIRQIFESEARPLKPADVLELAQSELPNIGQATVYRAINALVDEGWLKTVELPGEPAHYERSGIGHHHHFHCRKCSRVFDIHDCPGDLTKMAPDGFSVESHELVLYGLCDECG